METKDAVIALAALAQAHRLEAFRLLVQAGPSGLPAGKLAERLGIAPNTLSFHVRELAQAGLVTASRDGRTIRYAADFTGMTALLGFLIQDCCGLTRDQLAGCCTDKECL